MAMTLADYTGAIGPLIGDLGRSSERFLAFFADEDAPRDEDAGDAGRVAGVAREGRLGAGPGRY